MNKQDASSSAVKQSGEAQFGYVTLDQNKRIVPMYSKDETRHKYVLVGVWVWGLEVSMNDQGDRRKP